MDSGHFLDTNEILGVCLETDKKSLFQHTQKTAQEIGLK